LSASTLAPVLAPERLTAGRANAIIGTDLGAASKMPGRTFGLSAHDCRTGGKLHDVPDSICSGCYALKGRYVMANVDAAHRTRMEALRQALADPDRADLWVLAMATRIRSACKGEPYFRWHDSGDLQSTEHLELIVRVCRATPDVRHWLPTRERGFVAEYIRRHGLIRRQAPNLTVRLSDAMVDQDHRRALPGTRTSGAHTNDAAARSQGAHVCPAPRQENSCGACRACWNPRVNHVSYHVH
jgi:hypothetical protein